MIEHQARLDLFRRPRLGMVEAIWGQHKTVEQISSILRRFQAAGELALVTRVDPEKASDLAALVKNVQFHPEARCITVGEPPPINPSRGEVVVLSGGMSDVVVAAEAELSLRCHGITTELILDVGVAGLHRLLDQLERS